MQRQPGRWLLGLLACALAGLLGHAVTAMPGRSSPTFEALDAAIARAGVDNPVTAVLLNFRAYDTLLEELVLLVAVFACWSLGVRVRPPSVPPSMLLDALVRLLVPMLVLMAGYLLWAGADRPGGAFQAGAVLGAAGIAALLGGRAWPSAVHARCWEAVLVFGIAAYLGVGVFTVLAGGWLLEYPPAMAGTLILLIETASVLAIAATLIAIYQAAVPWQPVDTVSASPGPAAGSCLDPRR